jgi:hypothetical protein
MLYLNEIKKERTIKNCIFVVIYNDSFIVYLKENMNERNEKKT